MTKYFIKTTKAFGHIFPHAKRLSKSFRSKFKFPRFKFNFDFKEARNFQSKMAGNVKGNFTPQSSQKMFSCKGKLGVGVLA